MDALVVSTETWGLVVSEQLQFEEEEINIVLRRAWDRALRTLSTRVNKPTFETHIRAIRPLTLSETRESGISVYQITLGVPSAFTREWVEKRHSALITDVLAEILDRDVQLTFVISPRDSAKGGAASRNTAQQATPRLFDSSVKESASAPPIAPTLPLAVAPVPDTPSSTNSLGSRVLQLLMEDESAPTSEPEPDISADTAWVRSLTSRVAQAEASEDERGPAPKMPVPPATTSSQARTPGETGERASAPVSRAGSQNRGPSQIDAPALNPRYTFENFVVGHSNRLAHAGAYQVAQDPGVVYNPLFLYGPPGLGKTHLMHAIGNQLVQARGLDGSRIAYVSGEAFTSSFITSLREHRTEEFRRKWRSIDLWLVDDIQFIASKEHTKEEFFHTFNTLYQMGKQIVISSDRSPRDLRMMDERLRSRFECGLIADIASPDLETRLAILHRKSEIERMRIPDEVLLYMARLVQSNIRTLEGALVKLIAYASLQNSPVTTELASTVLERYYIHPGMGDSGEASEGNSADVGGQRGSGAQSIPYGGFTGGRKITAEIVQRVVAKRFNLSTDSLTGKRRDKETAHARQIAMHLLRELTDLSLPGIGDVFGGRDHSTVAYACEKVKTQLDYDDSLRSLVEDLVLQLKSQASG